MDRRGDHESVIAGGRYRNRCQSASQPLAAARRERQWQTSVQNLPWAFALSDPSLTAPRCSVDDTVYFAAQSIAVYTNAGRSVGVFNNGAFAG